MHVVLLALQANGPKWTDVAGFIAASAGVVVTLLAVLVALFGPRWQARRSQPKLSLSVQPMGISWPVGGAFGAQPMMLLLHNAEGRDTARDVEVFAYVAGQITSEEDMPAMHVPADTDPLVFENPLGSNPVRTIGSIPAGFSRKVYWALVGEPRPVAQAFAQDVPNVAGVVSAAVAVDPYGRTEVPWMDFQAAYVVDLIVTGSNFDALYFSGVFESYMSEAEDAHDGGLVGYTWAKQPEPVAPELGLAQASATTSA